MKEKYLILDFGKVLAGPTTGNWFITPKFLELIDMNQIDIDKINIAFSKYNYIISRKAETEQEEYKIFYEFYSEVLKEINYLKYDKKIIEELAYNFAYEDDKYKFYEGIVEELEVLSKEYKLILLSDNWPSVIRIMKNANIYDYFEKLYISSVYEEVKKDKVLFDYPIKEFSIKQNEAIFVDDNEQLLDIACEKGLDVRLMNREKDITKSKYKVITNLHEI